MPGDEHNEMNMASVSRGGVSLGGGEVVDKISTRLFVFEVLLCLLFCAYVNRRHSRPVVMRVCKDIFLSSPPIKGPDCRGPIVVFLNILSELFSVSCW